MNANKYIFFIALIATFFFTSCDNEPIDSLALTDQLSPCQAPFTFTVSPFINDTTVRIEWDKSSGTGAYEIQYGIQGFQLGTGTTVNFTNNSSLIGGLVSTINYHFYIRTRCNDGYYSDWVGPVVPGGTGVTSCPNPTNLTATRSLTDPTSATVTWSSNSSANSWQMQYGVVGFTLGSGAIVAATTPSKVIFGLLAEGSYQVYVRSNCDTNQNSNWVGPVLINPVGVTSCNAPTNVTVVRPLIDPTTVAVAWSSTGDANSWQIQYGVVGFTLGSGTIVAASTPSKTINGLIAEVSYQVYVRSNCEANQNSNWVGPINIPPVGVISNNSFFALVDGIEFVDVGAINVNANSLLYGMPSIYIIATDAQNNVIEINISNDAVVGTEYFNNNLPTDKLRFVYFNPLPTELEVDTGGSLTVTERTATRIKGIFHFSAINAITQTIEVTNGTFDLAIP